MGATSTHDVLRFLNRPLVLRTFVVLLIIFTLVHFSNPIQEHADKAREKWQQWKEKPEHSEPQHISYTKPSNHTPPHRPRPPPAKPKPQKEVDEDCPVLPGLERLVITVKTGATEASARVPTLLSTSLRCAENVFVFSDMEEQVGELHVYDSLDTIKAPILDHPDFDLYKTQYKLKAGGTNIAALKGMDDPRLPGDAAWALDKYKNIHIVEKTWRLRPNMDWYLHIDADTYVMLPSLVHWLRSLNHTEPHYMGSLTSIGLLNFAHGGSGILLSQAATKNFIDIYDDTKAAEWDESTSKECCGDYMLGRALTETEAWAEDVAPNISGQYPATVPFGPERWCHLVGTLHHVSPMEAELLGKFERQRKDRSRPVSYAELYTDFMHDRISSGTVDDWENGASNIMVHASSAAECRHLCKEEPGCWRSMYTEDAEEEKCGLGTDFMLLGNPEKGRQSSWNRERFDEWIAEQKPCD